MDGRILHDEVLLAHVLLKQTGDAIYQRYRVLLVTHAEHALTLVASIMYLQHEDLLEEHFEIVTQTPEHAFQAALDLVALQRSELRLGVDLADNESKVANSLFARNTAKMAKSANCTVDTLNQIRKYPFLASYREQIFSDIAHARLLTRGLVLLHNNKLSKMIPYILDNPKDSYQLANGFVRLAESGYLNDKANVDALIACSAVASHAAELIILLRALDLSEYLEPLQSDPEFIHALLYVMKNHVDKKYLGIQLKNALNKTETLSFIHYAYRTICENAKLHFMALTSPADKAHVIIKALEKRFQRKSLKSNCTTFNYKTLQLGIAQGPATKLIQ